VYGADVMIYDSTYDDMDFAPRVGRGHSTWQEALRLAEAANVKRVALFHHHPAKSDDALDEIAEQAKAIFPASVMAHEGLTLEL
jgi:ribonuclease BN (tRNA processing enzyme)